MSAKLSFAFYFFINTFRFKKMSYFGWNLLLIFKNTLCTTLEKLSISNLEISEEIEEVFIK